MFNSNTISFIIWKKTDKYHCLANNCNLKNGSKMSSYMKTKTYEKSYLKILETSKDQIIHNKIKNDLIILKYIPDDVIIELNTQMSTNVQLLSSLSHKIRNPLTNILGTLTDVDKSKLTKNQKKQISIIKKSCYEIVGTLNDVIDIVDFFKGELKLKSETVKLSDLLNQCQSILMNELKNKNLSLKKTINNVIPKKITTDRTKLQQILVNILTNSIQHLSIGGIIIDVTIYDKKIINCPFKYVSNNDSKKYNLLFSIKDSGSGMDESKINLVNSILGINNNENIIDIYAYGGLGLTISKFICNLMGGNIWFKTNDNVGTTFYFNILCDKIDK